MEENKTQMSVGNKSILREILYVLKKNLILLLAVIFVVTAAGGVYAFLRKPSYVATEKLLFRMGDSAYIADDINTMGAYKSTVQSFANQGKVVDRANYYATKYYEFFKVGEHKVTLEQFIDAVESLEGQIKSYENEKEIWEEIKEISTTLHENHISNSIDGVKDTLEAQKQILYGCAFLMQQIRYEQTLLEMPGQTDAEIKAIKTSLDKNKKSLSTLLKKEALLISEEVFRLVMKDIRDKDPDFAQTFLDQTNYETLQASHQARIDEIDDEISTFQTEGFGQILFYDVNDPDIKAVAGQEPYISANAIGINHTDQDEKSFVFSISYTEDKEDLAKEKVKLLTLAFNIESSYFFTAKNTSIDDLGLVSCNVDMAKSTIILIAFAIGVLLGAITVYLVYVLDKTIKTKEEAERIAECAVLACIEPQEEVQK